MSEVLLRDVTEADLPNFFEDQRDPEATAMAAFEARDRDAFMAHWANILADGTVTTRTVLLDGQIAGNVVSWAHDGQRFVGYRIGRKHWDKGIATQALTLFLQVEGERPLYAHVAKHNVGSIRVLEKCGFTVVGEHTVSDAHGENVAEYVYELHA